jgi:calcineurin-like phosphoesterase family protein
MSRVFVTSDWHLGHRNIPKYRPQITTVEENTELIIDNYLSIVGKRDVVYFLGDISFTQQGLYLLKTLPGRKILILGNHCTEHLPIQSYVDTFDKVHGIYSKYGTWFTHAPIHPSELRGKFNIHGHTHIINVDDPKYFNACVDNTDFKPVDVKAVIEQMTAETQYPDWLEKLKEI